ncbi:MAG: Arabinose import ATP-binding protein AraG [Burkholderia gladioli]|nr:MAG: Arabinose import ATP-binding protein AraG [Burkholderia gladioli]
MAAVLRFDNIGKVFPGVRALDGISFDVHGGQVHGLMGENGAGKSTLLKILGGEYQPDSGSVLVDGEPVKFTIAAASIAAGIAVIHQELQYVPDLTAAENLMLDRLPNALGFVRKGDARRHVRERLEAMGVDLDPGAKLRRLSIAQRQMVEICKALMRNARVIALDEPTSSLSHRETEVLFKLVDDLRADGRALIYMALLKFEWVKRAAGVRKPTSQNGIFPPLVPPQGGEVLAAGRARGPGGARLCLARALKRARRFLRIKGSLRRASPALDPEKSTHSKFKRGIYISHRMDEIYRLCDACAIFRDGRRIASHPVLAEVTRDQMVSQMVGREINDIYHYRPRELGAVRLEADNVAGDALKAPASFSVRAGEIVGFFGLVGAGRRELMRVIYGADRKRGGALTLDGKRIEIRRTGDAILHGIVLCPEDRKEEGIVAMATVAENINISCLRHSLRAGIFLNDRKEAETVERFINLLKIKTPSRRQKIRFLSGGNQQKAILSRWLAEPDLKVVILDEPTRGIDVGAKNEIYQVIYELAERGCAIVMVSSELPEVLGVSDRVVVMREGRIAGELTRADANEQAVLSLALPQQGPSEKAA